jgi:hypothetical protein
MGWRDEARKAIVKRLEKVIGDEDLTALLKHLDDDLDDDNGNGILLIVALVALLKKRILSAKNYRLPVGFAVHNYVLNGLCGQEISFFQYTVNSHPLDNLWNLTSMNCRRTYLVKHSHETRKLLTRVSISF